MKVPYIFYHSKFGFNFSVQELVEILLFVVTNVKYPFVNEAKLWKKNSQQRLSIFTEFK